MWYLIIMGVLLLFLVIALLMGVFASNSEDKTAGFAGAGLIVVLGIIVTVIFSANSIPARTVAVQTTFGTNPEVVDAGFHMLPPWAETEEFSTLLQPLDLNDKDGSDGNAVNVTFTAPKTETINKDGTKTVSQDEAGGGKGKVSSVVNWRILEDSKDGPLRLWQSYTTFDRVRNELVRAKAQTVIMDVAQDYTAGVASVGNEKIAAGVKTRLGEVLKPFGIAVVDVSVYGVDLDANTTASLQKIVDNINRTRAYEEELKGAQVQSRILEEQKRSGQLAEESQQRFCLNILNSWDVKTNGPAPATLNCGLGASVTPVLPVK
jgi:regulator of protease activity HflC (stomatin/prohibitin superfamily)